MGGNQQWSRLGSSTTSPVDNRQRKTVKAKATKTENIIFVGSEQSYDSFWLKMMFIASAYVIGSQGHVFRQAHKKTLAYVDSGYTRFEKLTLDTLADQHGFDIVSLESSSDVVDCLNRDRATYKLQDVAFFSHGVLGKIALNYSGDFDVNFSGSELNRVSAEAFVSDGRIYSYACRTGISVQDLVFAFKSDEEAGMENSLAQKMADRFGVEVHAFLRRTFYGNVLRDRAQSSEIASTLKAARKSQDGQLIEISAEHQGLPHPGLADGFFNGASSEGTDNYALWRKQGGRGLPEAADTPKGLSSGMKLFKPRG